MWSRIYRRSASILLNKNIAFLWLGQVISQAGDSIYEIGLLWIMLELTGSKSATGLVAMSAYLPTLFFGMMGGVLADRFDRRRLMMIADIARGIIALIIPLLYFLDGLSGLMLGVLTFALAMFNTIFNPARDAIIFKLVGRDKLRQANSLIQTSWQFALMLGPALAGIIIPLVGVIHLFNVDALTFFVSLWFISKISAGSSVPVKKTIKMHVMHGVLGSFRDVLEGLEYAWKDKRIWTLVMITAIDNLFIMGPALVGAPIFVREILKQNAAHYAISQMAYAFGMIAGTILLNFFGKKFRNSHLLLWGIILDGLTFLPLLWINTFWGFFVVLMIHSLMIPLIIVPRPTLIQQIVPEGMQGRIFSLISVAVFGLTAVSMALTGIAADLIAINYLYAIIAVFAAASGAVGWFIKDFRNAP